MTMKHLSDESLWRETQRGSAEAWEVLVRRYKSLVYSVCSFMGLSQSDAADCFQQTWVQLYHHRHRLEDPGRVSSWLVTTARREAMRLRRSSSRFVSSEESPEQTDNSPLPDAELEQLELQAQLEEALHQIDMPCQKLLSLYFFADEDLSYEQIANEMGLAPNTLGAKKRRCLGKLRQILADLGFNQERN